MAKEKVTPDAPDGLTVKLKLSGQVARRLSSTSIGSAKPSQMAVWSAL